MLLRLLIFVILGCGMCNAQQVFHIKTQDVDTSIIEQLKMFDAQVFVTTQTPTNVEVQDVVGFFKVGANLLHFVDTNCKLRLYPVGYFYRRTERGEQAFFYNTFSLELGYETRLFDASIGFEYETNVLSTHVFEAWYITFKWFN